MKIRISGNSIRFRLRQPDVELFQKEAVVTATLAFASSPNNQLKFTLIQTQDCNISVNYKQNDITVGIPMHSSEKWFNTDLVGIEENVETEKGHFVHILIEKDFACLDAPQEENDGAYLNPKAIC
jgi:hypothetical protein